MSSRKKYNLTTQNQIEDTTESDGVTYLDSILLHLQQVKIEENTILKLYNYLEEEKYDTERGGKF